MLDNRCQIKFEYFLYLLAALGDEHDMRQPGQIGCDYVTHQ